MIIRAGENVYCVEIEHVLVEHPDILDAAVVGVPHRELGEEVKAVVQLRDGSTTTAEDVREYCARAARRASRCRSTSSCATSRCPRNPAGKVLKSVLRGDGAASAFTPSTADDSAL